MYLTNYKQTVFYCSLGSIKTTGRTYAEAIEKALNQLIIGNNRKNEAL